MSEILVVKVGQWIMNCGGYGLGKWLGAYREMVEGSGAGEWPEQKWGSGERDGW